ncbi:MAG: hypothetical protein IKU56_02320, partial [Clostridia bacterium]|nr:hypothetical protein [Clostridia bacterium]
SWLYRSIMERKLLPSIGDHTFLHHRMRERDKTCAKAENDKRKSRKRTAFSCGFNSSLFCQLM